MISNYEAQLFLKEVGLLIDEYYRCTEIMIKNQICIEIQQLTEIISSELVSQL
jgi:hypothetical protein